MIDMKNRTMKLVLLMMVTLICRDLFSQTSTTSLPTPELLRQKEFKTPIDSVAISSDGTKIAITSEPEVEKIKDDNYYTLSEHPEFRNPDGSYYKGIKYHFYGSKLYYLDNKGDILWEYEHKELDKMFMLSDVVMSDDGEYIVCSVIECKTEDREITHVLPATLPVPLQETKKMQTWEYSGILFFNSTGTLLWSFKAAGKPKISFDGSYVFIIPDRNESGTPLDDFYFLNKYGDKLWQIRETESIYADIYLYTGNHPGKISKDGEYVVIGNKLYDKDGKILYEKPGIFFTEISEDGSLGIAGIYGKEGPIEGWDKIICVDFKNKEILWERKKGQEQFNENVYRLFPSFHKFKYFQNLQKSLNFSSKFELTEFTFDGTFAVVGAGKKLLMYHNSKFVK